MQSSKKKLVTAAAAEVALTEEYSSYKLIWLGKSAMATLSSPISLAKGLHNYEHLSSIDK